MLLVPHFQNHWASVPSLERTSSMSRPTSMPSSYPQLPLSVFSPCSIILPSSGHHWTLWGFVYYLSSHLWEASWEEGLCFASYCFLRSVPTHSSYSGNIYAMRSAQKHRELSIIQNSNLTLKDRGAKVGIHIHHRVGGSGKTHGIQSAWSRPRMSKMSTTAERRLDKQTKWLLLSNRCRVGYNK